MRTQNSLTEEGANIFFKKILILFFKLQIFIFYAYINKPKIKNSSREGCICNVFKITKKFQKVENSSLEKSYKISKIFKMKKNPRKWLKIEKTRLKIRNIDKKRKIYYISKIFKNFLMKNHAKICLKSKIEFKRLVLIWEILETEFGGSPRLIEAETWRIRDVEVEWIGDIVVKWHRDTNKKRLK